KKFCHRFVIKNLTTFDKREDIFRNVLIYKEKIIFLSVISFMTKSKIKKTGNFITCFVIKYPVFIFDSMALRCRIFYGKYLTSFLGFF
ncbi:hypothetical protein, partial [Klebsiella pneumoniae]|uniref:hypothetical protein n=1 Tax=Klebsiella pneumoniae TaxID=573 RepID=UPI00307A866D